MSDRSPSLFAPIVIAALGLAPLALMASGVEAPPPTVEGPTVAEVTTTAAEMPEPVEVVVATPAPSIAGLSDEVARVLAAGGFAAEEPVDGLPSNVVALLQQQGVVLTIAVEGGG